MRETALSTKTIKLPTEEQTVCLHTITPCYLLMPSTSVGPVSRIKAISVANVANLMSKATAPLMGKLVTNVKVLIISERCVIQRYQTGQRRALTRRSHSNRPGKRLQAAMAKEEASNSSRRRLPKKHPPQKQKAYEVTFKPKMVLKETSGENAGNVSNPVLSGKVLDEESTYNRFSCFAVHSKMAQSTNTKSKPSEGLYTDTDLDNRSEIITDVTIRVPRKPGTMMMEVKVDPGVQPSCIPLQKFQTLFPHLCKDGLPRPGLLDNTQSEFESYNGGDMACYGHLLIDVKDKVTKKYHPIRFYVMNTDMPRILISHAASYWLGLVKVLCDNKAPQIKRQVASVDKKSNFRAKDGPKMTSTQRLGSSSQKREFLSKTVTSGKVPIPSPRMHNFKNTKIQGKSDGKGPTSGGGGGRQ